MKNLTILLAIVVSLFLCSCGGGSGEKEAKKDAETKEVTRLSKSTEEGMMQLLKQCNITVPENFDFKEVSKKSDNYVISFIAIEVDEAAKKELDAWYSGQVEDLVRSGWNKRVIRDNESMFGSVYNETILLKPNGSDADVSYGLTLSSVYDDDDSTYTLYISAN